MLVLMRRTGERILIAENIWVTLLSAYDGKARIGIEAPRDVAVFRAELLEAEHDQRSKFYKKPIK